jgi:hypothetical protein
MALADTRRRHRMTGLAGLEGIMAKYVEAEVGTKGMAVAIAEIYDVQRETDASNEER